MINSSPTYPQIVEILQYLTSVYPYIAQEPLGIRETSEFLEAWKEATAGDEEEEDDLVSTKKQTNKNNASKKEGKPYKDPFVIAENKAYDFDLSKLPEGTNIEKAARRHMEEEEAVNKLKSLQSIQNGTLSALEEAKEIINKYRINDAGNNRIAVYCMRVLKTGYERLKTEEMRQECVMKGHFAFILRMINMAPFSCTHQMTALNAFFNLMGGFALDERLNPPDKRMRRSVFYSATTQKVVSSTISSLATAPDGFDLGYFFSAMKFVVNSYNLTMSEYLKR